MKNGMAGKIALGGMLAGLAMVIMCMVGLIPIATYLCPMLCALLLQAVLAFCGERIAWAWYGAVAILSVLFAPDKEAAAVFVFLGYYPIVKPCLDRRKMRYFWKALLFNGSAAVMYFLLISVFGMAELASEFRELGLALGILSLVMGNVTFFLLDRLLTIRSRRRK